MRHLEKSALIALPRLANDNSLHAKSLTCCDILTVSPVLTTVKKEISFYCKQHANTSVTILDIGRKTVC